MKKIIITLLLTAVFLSCDDRMEELNRPKKNAVEVTAESLFANGLREIYDLMINTDVNVNVFRLYSQYWAQTTYPDESQYNMVGRRIPDNFWTRGYRDALQDLNESALVLNDTWEVRAMDEAVKDNWLAVIDINKAFVFSVLVDAFGAVPFTQALDPEILSPAYDDGAAVYTSVIAMLDNALAMIDVDADGFPANQDPVYEGDMEQWIKFANTLKLKLAITTADVEPGRAATLVSQALAGGVFESNADNAAITYQSTAPSTNPVWEDLVQSGRADYVVANTFIDKLNDLKDPRLHVFAETTPFVYRVNKATGSKKDSVITTGKGRFLSYPNQPITYKTTPFTIFAADSLSGLEIYNGGIYGTANTYSQRSHIGDLFHQPSLEGLILDYSEVQFLLAEAAERGITTPMTAEEHYNEGITASLEYWGVSDTEIAAYLASPDVAYATAENSGTWKQKIGVQQWIAFYNRGFEGWSTWRRLDFTGFNVPPLLTYDDIPNRFIFPIEEATLNPSNLNAAIDLIGGTDDVSTKVFWDVN